MATKSYSEQISDTQVLLSGIRANISVLAERKIDENFVNNLETNLQACISLNNEQEQLKARLKEKTSELNEKMDELKKKSGEARKIIKLDMPKTAWKEFGIGDKM